MEREAVMREALERARHDLTVLAGLTGSDETMTLRWINAALDGLEPLVIDPKAEPPEAA